MGFSNIGLINTICVVLFIVTIVVLLVPTITLIVRRLHDTERKGTLVLLSLVPFMLGLITVIVSLLRMTSTVAIATPNKLMIGTGGIVSMLFIVLIVPLILTIIWCSLPGNEGPNKFGPDPNAK